MNAAILCVGRLRESFWRAAADEYKKRLSRFGKFEEIEVADRPKGTDEARVLREEGKDLLRRIREDDDVIALCVDGRAVSSEQLAKMLREREVTGRRTVFVIGGSLGLSPEVVARAGTRLSFSLMTFPHQLARVMLYEQIYRACKINAGERYHK
ncbi:MAG: 23S rRNA (pseudouridine(1915)-N(3))-methyltransferase RlmH [Clostridiales bacterium]|nr:23S rRNA (pseudouridine(1915)-N(3))-methyltransferase RlmH [Clostridiales bacterium]